MKANAKLSVPLWVQILAVVFGALVSAQLVTLGLTIFFPPSPPQQHDLAEVAAALQGKPVKASPGVRPLVRTIEPAPPSLQSPGWVVSVAATRDLARLVDAPESSVRLLFYSPPPLAGAAPAPPAPPRPSAQRTQRVYLASYLVLAQAGPPGRGTMGGMGPGGRTGPGPSAAGSSQDSFSRHSRSDRQTERSQSIGGPRGEPGEGGRPSHDRRTGSLPDREAGQAGPSVGRGALFEPLPRLPSLGGSGVRGVVRTPLEAAVFADRTETQPNERSDPGSGSDVQPAALPTPGGPMLPGVREQPAVSAAPAAPAAEVAPPPIASVGAAAEVEGKPLAPPVQPGVFFGLAQAPQVEGEFVAALRLPDGRWAMVRPLPEGFLSSWQRRVVLWFALSLALIGPIALAVAWRLARPLHVFAEAAERLGREPAGDIKPLSGPAEIGRAASAFNVMQARLKRYIEDRVGMVSAISHDLRTPLARMRFKLERASPALRSSMGRDMDQMEEMIRSVLNFMRDDSVAAPREVVDLRSLLEVIVDDGGDEVELAGGSALLVEIDVLGVQRVFENLVNNAVKYGERAVITLRSDGEEAVVEVADQGPGLSEEDLQQVFKPFYRSADAVASGKAGVGLGLPVSRSTIRAHGGELTLRSGSPGLVAEVRLPLSKASRLAA